MARPEADIDECVARRRDCKHCAEDDEGSLNEGLRTIWPGPGEQSFILAYYLSLISIASPKFVSTVNYGRVLRYNAVFSRS